MDRRLGAIFQGNARLAVGALHPMTVRTYPHLCVGLVPSVQQLLKECGAAAPAGDGILAVYTPHGGVTLNENCDSSVRTDMLEGLRRVASNVCHRPDTDHPPLSTVFDIVGRTAAIPIAKGSPTLGTWQGVYLFFHADAKEIEVTCTLYEGRTKSFKCNANARASHDITASVVVGPDEMAVVHTHHTSASLSQKDRAGAPGDLEPIAEAIIPFAWNDEFFEHTYEGRDDMPGHMKSTVLGCGCVTTAEMLRSKVVVLNEHRDVGGYGCGHTRTVTTACMRLPTDANARRTLALPENTRCGEPVDVTPLLRDALKGAGGATSLFVAPASGGQLALLSRDHNAVAAYFTKDVRGVPLGAVALPHSVLAPVTALEHQNVYHYAPAGDAHAVTVVCL